MVLSSPDIFFSDFLDFDSIIQNHFLVGNYFTYHSANSFPETISMTNIQINVIL